MKRSSHSYYYYYYSSIDQLFCVIFMNVEAVYIPCISWMFSFISQTDRACVIIIEDSNMNKSVVEMKTFHVSLNYIMKGISL